jgi:hypothetical protein
VFVFWTEVHLSPFDVWQYPGGYPAHAEGPLSQS